MSRQARILTLTGPFCLLLAGAYSALASAAQNAAPPSIAEQLTAQYKVVKLGSDSGGLAVLDPGTVLVIQKAGILGVPLNYTAVGAAKYQDGVFHPSKGLRWLQTLNQMSGSSTQIQSRFFQTGDRVYPLKIDVNLKSEKISFGIVACDSCNGTNPPTFYKGEVNFQFDKGYLEKSDVSQIEDTIGQVFALDNGDSGQQAQGPAGAPNQAQAQAQTPAQAAPPAQAQPQTVQLGQTTDQVEAVLGKPNTIVDLGAKKKWVYKDLKITFVDGKVSDVE